MLVTTGEVSNILTTTADITGDILDLGEGATNYGHCYSTSINSSISASKTDFSSPTIGGFTSALSGLTPSTKYYIKAYLKRGNDVVYGDEITFSTASASLPQLTTAEIAEISKTTAVSGGNVTSEGGTPVTMRGICWSQTTNPTIDNSKVQSGSGSGSFSCSMTNLTPDQKYYVRAFATNIGGTSYGNELNFITLPDVLIPPTVTTAIVTSVTAKTALCGGEVTSEGTSHVTQRGVCWSTSVNPTILNNKTLDSNGPGIFVSTIGELLPGTIYFLRAYATNSAGTGYGNEVSFTTLASVPLLTTVPATAITTSGASTGGEINSTGGASILAKGVCWSTSTDPTINNDKTDDGSGPGIFSSIITGLSSGTTYYVRSFATNSAGTGYGNLISFVTTAASLPTVSTTAISIITQTTANSGGDIGNDGGAPVVSRGVCWNTLANPTIANFITTDNSGSGPFTSNLTGLSPNTTYYVKAYATNIAGTAYGNEISFITAPTIPTLTTNSSTGVTSTSAICGGNIISDGGDIVFNRGICWSTSSDPTISNSVIYSGNGTGLFSVDLTGLSPNTDYFVKAFAKNNVGISYGNEVSFKTSVGLPTITTIQASSVTISSAQSGGIILSDGGAPVTSRGTCWNTTPNPTTSNFKTSDDSGIGSFISDLTGLTTLTTYYLRAYATNSIGTKYGNEVSFTTSISVTHTTGAVAPVTKTVSYGIVLTNISGENKFWITQNLGANNSASSATDASETSAGWYWQFNRKQGYKYDGSTRTPNTAWISNINESSNWTLENDPCALLLGTGWRIPTNTEWTNADNNGLWNNYNNTYSSVLKLHGAGSLAYDTGILNFRGSAGLYWSGTGTSVTGGSELSFNNVSCNIVNSAKSLGFTLRCIK
jgi:hypothetical protein